MINNPNYRLDILIPTYNRSKFLKINLEILTSIISRLGLSSYVHIIISDNCSVDDTPAVAERFKGDFCSYYRHNENIGLEQNAVFVLNQSNADYIMYLGDDDYINENYLVEVLKTLCMGNVGLIVPNFTLIDEDGNDVPNTLRDTLGTPLVYEQGSFSGVSLSLKCHQLSGVVYKREGLYESYIDSNITTLYPFIFWGCIGANGGTTVHIRNNPVLVTTVAQHKKDWDYGEHGLILDKFICFYYAISSESMRSKLERKVLQDQSFMIISYTRKSVASYFNLLFLLLSSKYTTVKTKALLPFYSVNGWLVNIPRMFKLGANKLNWRIKC